MKKVALIGAGVLAALVLACGTPDNGPAGEHQGYPPAEDATCGKGQGSAVKDGVLYQCDCKAATKSCRWHSTPPPRTPSARPTTKKPTPKATTKKPTKKPTPKKTTKKP